MASFVSVIVITRNNAKTIDDCIIGLLHQTCLRESYEIIVVDGHSTDGNDKIVEKYASNDSSIRLFYENQGTMGFARNLGISKSKGDIISFTDGDAVLPTDWIERIVDMFKHDVKLIAIGGFDKLVSSSESSRVIDSWRRLKRVTGVKAIPCIKTVNFAIRREAIISCGGFDQSLSHWDETELLARLYAKTKNGNILYDPNLVVYHKREQTSSISRVRKVFRKSLVGTPVLMRKHMMEVAIANPFSPLATSFYMILICVVGLPIFALSIVTGLFVDILLSALLIYLIMLGIYFVRMFLKTRIFVPVTPLILTIDFVVRIFGTLIGIAKWIKDIFTRSM
jgi:glycosyltransferase involved in cell wall biosynthesis